MDNYIWYFNRFTKMPLPEISYRIVHKLHEKNDKRKTFHFPILYDHFLKTIWLLSEHVSTESLERYLPDKIQKILEQADRYLQNRFDIFGIETDFGDKIDWHLDPKTGKAWPIKFWADINHRNGHGIGGVKFVWEINRFYFLPILGLVYRISGDTKYAKKILGTIHEWQIENPYPFGVNWTSGIELGIRIANLVWTLSFLKEYRFSEKDYISLNKFIFSHARHLYRYPSKYSSNNNHALAEGFGLFLAGLYFPHFIDAKKWFKFGKNLLEQEIKRQILPDGGSLEYTTTYLSLVFDFFLLYKLVCEKNGIAYDPVVDKRLEKSCEYIQSLMDTSGNIANIGDQDSAILLNFGLDNHKNFKSILNTGSVMFGRPEFAKVSFPDIKTLILLGENAFRIKPDKQQWKNEARIFKESGLSLIRDNTTTKELVFVGNATPLGMPPLYAHGHLDAASFWLSVDGKEVFVDPGTYLYHSGGKWRKYFRSTTAHNTVRLDTKYFTEQPGDFMFGKPYRITLNELQESENEVVWRVGHDAYERLKPPVTFIREVKFTKESGQFLFTDTMKSKGSHYCEIYFHLHPECITAIEQNQIWITRSEVKLCMEIDQRLSIQSYRGSENPLLGWFSEHFNHLTETTTLLCSSHFSGSVTYTNKLQII